MLSILHQPNLLSNILLYYSPNCILTCIKPLNSIECNINCGTILNFEQYQFFLDSSRNSMISQTAFKFYKIHFSMSKRVKYGQGVFVCGNIQELGQWDVSKAYRLKWNEGDIWSGSILLPANTPPNIQFKYIISDWNNANLRNVQWQTGSHNRELDLSAPRTVIICDDKWNMDRITLTLHVAKSKNTTEQKLFVVGDLPELGSWQQKKQMKKINKRYRPIGKKQNLGSPSMQANEQTCYSYTFYTFRGRSQFYYYYIKKGAVLESERRPGRVFKFQNKKSIHPYRKDIVHQRGDINIIDQCNINQLIFSQITPQIFVGSYPKSAMDIQKLKQHNISAIFSIQSERDFKHHGLTPHYLSLICQQQKMRYKRYSILDMNNADFVSKAEGGVKMMRDLIKQGEKVYVHCSAGIYRSPQMIALYLTLFEKYTIDQAVNIIKDHHPYAKPNCKVIKQAIGLISLHHQSRKLLI